MKLVKHLGHLVKHLGHFTLEHVNFSKLIFRPLSCFKITHLDMLILHVCKSRSLGSVRNVWDAKKPYLTSVTRAWHFCQETLAGSEFDAPSLWINDSIWTGAWSLFISYFQRLKYWKIEMVSTYRLLLQKTTFFASGSPWFLMTTKLRKYSKYVINFSRAQWHVAFEVRWQRIV